MDAAVILARLEGKFDAHLAKTDALLEQLVDTTRDHCLMIYGTPPESMGLDKRLTIVEGRDAIRVWISRTALAAGFTAIGGWLLHWLKKG